MAEIVLIEGDSVSIFIERVPLNLLESAAGIERLALLPSESFQVMPVVLIAVTSSLSISSPSATVYLNS